MLDEIRQLSGVREVEQAGARVTVHGSRRIIAHVGATLVLWGSVPDDLSVHVPNLDDAMLSLLGQEPAAAAPVHARSELIGGQR
jgi:hypothetical protein